MKDCIARNGTLFVRLRTEVNGHFPLPVLASLTPGDQHFIIEFVKSSGSLKEMARYFGLSYPSVRNRLD